MSEPDNSADDDGDRILDLIGIVLVLAVLGAIAVLVLAAMNTAPNGSPDDGPPVDWRLEQVDDTHVRIEHGGGPGVQSDEIFVTVDGRARHLGWSGEVEPGDTAVVRAEAGQTVRVFWTGDPGKQELQREWTVT